MNKSVLVINTPKNCMYCPLCFYTEMYNEHQCNGIECTNSYARTITEYGEGADRPDWCPLSPLPSPISLKQYVDNAALNIESILNYQYAQGYNDCLEEIINKEGT